MLGSEGNGLLSLGEIPIVGKVDQDEKDAVEDVLELDVVKDDRVYKSLAAGTRRRFKLRFARRNSRSRLTKGR